MASPGIADISLEWMLRNAETRGLRLKRDWNARLAPDPGAEVRQSRRHVSRLAPERKRRLPPGSKVHQSVVDRMRLLGEGYAPINLPEPDSYFIVK